MNFQVFLTSFEQIKSFVALAMRQPFDIKVGNDRQCINGKDFMGMCTLDFSRPVQVQADCTADEGAEFHKKLLAFQG